MALTVVAAVIGSAILFAVSFRVVGYRPDEQARRTFSRWLTRSLAVLLLACITIFNLPAWAVSGLSQDIAIQPSQVSLSKVQHEPMRGYVATAKDGTITLAGPGTRVANVHLGLSCNSRKAEPVFGVSYADTDSSSRTVVATITEAAPSTQVVQIRPYGNVDRLSVSFRTWPAMCSITGITINRHLPITMPWWQLVVWTLLIAAVGTGARHRRALSQELGKPRLHRLVSVACATAIIGFFAFTVVTSAKSHKEYTGNTGLSQYTKALPDALKAGHAYLNYPVSDSLRADPDPYDISGRHKRGTDALWDVAYYDGHYYSYFGIVPALALFLPYHLLVGGYLDTSIGIILFGGGAILALMAVWRSLCRQFLMGIPHSLYFAGLIGLPMSSMLLYAARRPHMYEVAVTSGLLFAATGVALLLQAQRQRQRSSLWVAAGCSCLALAVGCRPNLLLCSVLVVPLAGPWLFTRNLPVVQRIGRAAAIMVPYIVVGAPLALYNHVRFGSIFEFGQNYQITTQDNGSYTSMSAAGMVEKAVDGLTSYIFQPYRFSTWFPFVTPGPVARNFRGYIYSPETVGLICIPICLLVLSLPWLKDAIQARSTQLWWLLVAAVGVGFLLMLITTITVGVFPRYLIDFSWLFILAGLVAAYFIYMRFEGTLAASQMVLAGASSLIIVGALGVFFLSFTGPHDLLWVRHPELYLQLQQFFAPMEWGFRSLIA